MIGGIQNPTEIKGQPVPSFKRYRQFYFAFDTDLYRADGLSPLSTTLLKLNRTFKMPAPAIEWNVRKTDSLENVTRFPERSNVRPSDNEPPVRSGKEDGIKGHWIYF